MTVRELIALLKQQSPDAKVFWFHRRDALHQVARVQDYPIAWSEDRQEHVPGDGSDDDCEIGVVLT